MEIQVDIEELEKALRELRNKSVHEKVVKKLPEIKAPTCKDTIKCLNTAYLNEKLVFVLGAGVSFGYGLPLWDEILQKLMVTTIEEEQSTSSVLAKLFNNIFKPNPIIAGRYLQQYYIDNELSFEEAVQKALYENCNCDNDSKLMNEIVNFCVAPGKSPNLDSIITYNFDDILEHKLLDVGIDIPFKSIYGVGMNSDNGELPIYHVHGYLPREGKLNGLNKITFGESIYHEHYNDVYSWNNITQINKFKDNTCLFIGSSLTDPNIRRLLDIARLQKGLKNGCHYIFKKRYSEHMTTKDLKILLDKNKVLLGENVQAELQLSESVKLLIEIIERFEENDSLSFGVKTIWVNDFDEIPHILAEIRKLNEGS